ncbi:MAG: twin-arginine translocase TatA/TatE family subunit [Thermoleophilia bacterium]
MPNLGPWEIGAILLVVLLLFGATRLPKLGRSMGQSIRGFKKGLQEELPDDDDDELLTKSEPKRIEKGSDSTTS